MLLFRRFLLVSLLVLTGLVVGCQSKPASGGSADTILAEPTPDGSQLSESMKKKLKKLQEQPEGPSLQPPK